MKTKKSLAVTAKAKSFTKQLKGCPYIVHHGHGGINDFFCRQY